LTYFEIGAFEAHLIGIDCGFF